MTTHSSMPFPPSSSTIPSYVEPIVISDDEDTVPRLPSLSPSPAPQPSPKASPWLRSPIRLSSISRHHLDNDTPSAMYEPLYMSARQKRIIQRRASRLDQLSRAALFQQRLDRENAICDAAKGIRNRQLHARELQMAIYHREQALLRQPVSRLLQGYAKTRGFRVTGHAGTGAVPYLAYPDRTAYPHRGISGIDRYSPRSLLSSSPHHAFYSGEKITSRYMKKRLEIEG